MALTFEVVGTIDAKNHATHDLALSRDGLRLFATNLASGRLSVIDTAAMEVVGSVYTGARSHVVALTNDDRQAWVANVGEDNVSIVEVSTLRILGSIATGKGPTGLAFSRDGRFAYVSNQGDKTVAVVDTAAQVVVKHIPVGTNPHFLVLGPDGRIWGCNSGANDVYVIDPVSQDIVGSFQIGPAPQQIAFGYKGLAGPLGLCHCRRLQQGSGARGRCHSPSRVGGDRRGRGAEWDLGQSAGDAIVRRPREVERPPGHRYRHQPGDRHGPGRQEAHPRRRIEVAPRPTPAPLT